MKNLSRKPRKHNGVLSKNARKAHKANCKSYSRMREWIKSCTRPLIRAAFPQLVMDEIVKIEKI